MSRVLSVCLVASGLLSQPAPSSGQPLPTAPPTNAVRAQPQEARRALEAFITAWNQADMDALRRTTHFPFVTIAGAERVQVASTPAEFTVDFERMRSDEDWTRSSFDFESLEVFASSAGAIHCAINYERFDSRGERYRTGRVMYIVTEQDGEWGLQMRSPWSATPDSGARYSELKRRARQAVFDYFEAWNSADAEAVSKLLHYPHTLLLGGRVRVAEDAAGPGARPDFAALRRSEGWHVSTIESLEVLFVSESLVAIDLVFSRAHLDGTIYRTVPALWIMTSKGEHWAVQFRSILPRVWRPGTP